MSRHSRKPLATILVLLIATAAPAPAGADPELVGEPPVREGLDWVMESLATVGEVWTRLPDGSGFDERFTERDMALVPAANGLAAPILAVNLEPGVYDELRLVMLSGLVELINDAKVVDDHTFRMRDGDFVFPSREQGGVRVKIEPPIEVVTKLSEELTLDLDLDGTFLLDGSPTEEPGVRRVIFHRRLPAANTSTHGRITLRVVEVVRCESSAFSGALVTATDRAGVLPDVKVASDANGDAVLVLPPGTYDVLVEASGFAPVMVTEREVYVANETALGEVDLGRSSGTEYHPDTAFLLSVMSNVASQEDMHTWTRGQPLEWDQNPTDVPPCWKFFDYVDTDGGVVVGRTQAFVGYNENNGDLVIGFQGSRQLADWITDLIAAKVAWILPSGDVVGDAAHGGFAFAWIEAKGWLQSILADAVPTHVPDPSRSRVYFTGHSLGGALATLAALDLTDWLMDEYGYERENVVMYSYAAPRSMTEWLEPHFDTIVPHAWAIASWDDYVPHLPARGIQSPQYTHIRDLIVLTSNIPDRRKHPTQGGYRVLGETRVDRSSGREFAGCRIVGGPSAPEDYLLRGHNSWQDLNRLKNVVDDDGIPSIGITRVALKLQLRWVGGVQGPCDWIAVYQVPEGAPRPTDSKDYVRLNGREWMVKGSSYPDSGIHRTGVIPIPNKDYYVGYVDGFGEIRGTVKWNGSEAQASQGSDTAPDDRGIASASPATFPENLRIASAFPNPATSHLALQYAVPVTGDVRLTVYDVAGRRVRELAAGRRGPGEYAQRWDLRDGNGRTVGGGIYFVRLEAGKHRSVQKLVVTR